VFDPVSQSPPFRIISYCACTGNLTVRVTWKPPSPSQFVCTTTQFKLSNGEEVSYEKGGFVQIEVIDTGAGMSPDQVSRLFQAGVQFNVNELQAGAGSGLGLYIRYVMLQILLY